MSVQYIFVSISDVATLIGQNPWEYSVKFEKYWKKLAPDNYAESIQKLQNEVARDRMNMNQQEFLEKHVAVDILETAKSNNYASSKEKMAQVSVKTENLEPEMKKIVQSVARMSYGVKHEETALEMYAKKNDIRLDEIDTSQAFLKKRTNYKLKNTIPMYICGKVDGIYNNTLLEVKNRISKMMPSVPLYEQTQVQLYLWVLALQKGYLIQRFNSEIKEHEFNFDQKVVNDILSRLYNALDKLLSFIQNEVYVLEYLNLESQTERDEYMRNLFL